MRAIANYNWRRSRQKDTQIKAGRIYEHLVAQVLGCEISRQDEYEYADLHSIDLGIRVEVKARGDNNPFGLHTEQMDQYENDLPFPLSHTLYALVPYRSRRRIKAEEERPRKFSRKTTMISMLRFLKTDWERNEFWAANVEFIYLLDFRIVKGLLALLGSKKGHFAGRKSEDALVVNRTTLTSLFQDESFATAIRTLSLSASGWAKGVYPTRTRFTLDGQRLSSNFTLITVLRRSLHAKIASQLCNRAVMHV